MARLPEYRRQVGPQRPAGARLPAGTGASMATGWAGAFRAVDAALGQFADREMARAEAGRVADMAELGANAIEIGEDGLPKQPALRPNDSAANRAWNAAVTTAYENETEQRWASRFTERRGDFADNPDGFLAWAQEAASGATRGMDPRIAGRVGARLDALAQGHYRGLMGEQRQRLSANARASWQAQLGVIGDELAALSLSGQEGSEAFADATRRLTAHLTAGVAARHIDGDMERLTRDQISRNAVAFGIAGRAERIAREQGPDAARAYTTRALSDPSMAPAGSQAISAARAEANRRIAEVDGAQQVARSQANAEFRTVAANLRAGVTVPVARLEDLARRADTLGMPEQAVELRALGRVQSEIAASAALPLPQLADTAAAARERDPSDPASGLLVRELDAMVVERVRRLQADPVAHVDTLPAVRDVKARFARGEATMDDLVRARDAAMSAEGMDPIQNRVLSRADAERIKTEFGNLGPTEAAAKVLSVMQIYGPEMRYRVWNDLRDAGLPAHLRAAFFMASSPDGQRVMPQFIDAIREGDALERALPAGTGGQVREKVGEVMEGLRRTWAPLDGDNRVYDDALLAVQTLALRYARTETPADAARLAYRQVVEGALDFMSTSNARIRIPRGVDFSRAEFQAALGMMARNGLEAATFDLPPGAVSSAMSPPDQQAAYRSHLRSFGQWRTAPDGMGAWLYDGDGRPVLVNGQPWAVRFTDDFAELGNGLPFTALRERLMPVLQQASMREGVNAGVVAAVAGRESGWRNVPTGAAVAAPSSAFGPFQFTAPTWASLGLPPERRRVPEAQADAAPALAKQAATSFAAAVGRPMVGAELASAWAFGAEGAAALAKAEMDTRAADVVGTVALRNNGFTGTETVGQVRARFIRHMGGQAGVTVLR